MRKERKHYTGEEKVEAADIIDYLEQLSIVLGSVLVGLAAFSHSVAKER
jgi:hypothetical protein